MGLIILIVLAVIAIIILSAMGKLPSANQDSIK
jgi:Sec-independent protein translocase protein TatA